jgi:hypothetical protein
MARYSTNPPLFDSAFQISIKKLREWGYFKKVGLNVSTLTWSKNGNVLGSISIKTHLNIINPYIILDYTCNGTPLNYSVNLTQVPSNLGKGFIWFFICPHTGKRCRILYQLGNKFLHREAYNGVMYESQIQSKFYRLVTTRYGAYFNSENLYNELYKKHFKTHYKGKPTKRYTVIMNKINQADNIPYSEIEALYMRK